jgi:hypothetical protein
MTDSPTAQADDAAPDSTPLTAAPQTVLQAIYDYFSARGTWPTFIQIDRPIRREHGWDTADIVQQLPASVLVRPRGNFRPVPQDELRLTLEGIAACRGSEQDTARFVQTLRWLAQQEVDYQPATDTDDPMPRVTSAATATQLGLDANDSLSLQRLYAMLDLDHWGLGGFAQMNDGSWYVTLTPDIWRFRHVQTVDDCIKARKDWLAEGRTLPSATTVVNYSFPALAAFGPAIAPQTIDGGSATPDIEPPKALRSPYIAKQVTDTIRAKAGQSRFDLTKLLALIAELNDNYANENTYAAHALLRAILDHAPPILGYPTFQEAVNNYQWSRTDKQYMRKLLDFRSQADDALHRPISGKASLLDFTHMPPGIWVNQLLQECSDKL